MSSTIEEAGQPFVDQPVYAFPRWSVLNESVARAFNPRHRPKMPIILGHNRVRLNWIRPVNKRAAVEGRMTDKTGA